MNSFVRNRIPRAVAIGISCGATCFGLVGCKTVDENAVDDVRIQPTTLDQWLRKDPDRYLVIDARPRSAFEIERLPKAEQVDLAAIDPEDPDPRFFSYKGVVVYGQDPAFGRANALTKRLLESDVDVYLLDGGIQKWKLQGLPVVPGEAAATPPASPAN
jgi:rhodanese-related sulfurtransferase